MRQAKNYTTTYKEKYVLQAWGETYEVYQLGGVIWVYLNNRLLLKSNYVDKFFMSLWNARQQNKVESAPLKPIWFEAMDGR